MCEITKTTVPSVAGVAREEARKTPKAKQSSYDKLQTAIAVLLACVVLLNMASAAFIELVVWLLFHRLAPEVGAGRYRRVGFSRRTDRCTSLWAGGWGLDGPACARLCAWPFPVTSASHNNSKGGRGRRTAPCCP
jgi:hypothetical protein